MSVKNRRKNPILEPKNLVVTSIAAIFVVLVAVAMSFMLPKEEEKSAFDSSAWQSAVQEAESKSSAATDSGDAMTSVYNEDAVAATAEAVPDNADTNGNTAQGDALPENSDANTRSGSGGNTAPNTVRLSPPIAGAVTFDYSGDELVYSETMHDWRTHNGIDLAADEGSDVFASAAGTVEAVTDSSMMGTTIVILHDGGIRTIYSNLLDNGHVSVGDIVAQGAIIGKVGKSAAAESAQAPHLHFEVSFNEETVDPHDFLPETEETE